MSVFLSKKIESKLSYQKLSDKTGIHREYIRKLVINPGGHTNLKALALIGLELGISEDEVKKIWQELRAQELIKRVEAII